MIDGRMNTVAVSAAVTLPRTAADFWEIDLESFRGKQHINLQTGEIKSRSPFHGSK